MITPSNLQQLNFIGCITSTLISRIVSLTFGKPNSQGCKLKRHSFSALPPSLQSLVSVRSVTEWLDEASHIPGDHLLVSPHLLESKVKEGKTQEQLLAELSRLLDFILSEVSGIIQQHPTSFSEQDLGLLSECLNTCYRLKIWMTTIFSHYQQWCHSSKPTHSLLTNS